MSLWSPEADVTWRQVESGCLASTRHDDGLKMDFSSQLFYDKKEQFQNNQSMIWKERHTVCVGGVPGEETDAWNTNLYPRGLERESNHQHHG